MADMRVTCDSLLAGAKAARGTAVVVDVFRAFTCTPLLFYKGIERSILVATPEEALALKQRNGDLLLSGEVTGFPIEGFGLENSPSQILKKDPAVNHLAGNAWDLPQIKTAVKHGLGIQNDNELLLIR
jgi:2-phosphosulfolactate phosphatase